jgi:hypothetical protein
MLEQLERDYGVQLLWKWVKEYIDLQRLWDDDEQTPLAEWLWERAGLDQDRSVG